MLNTSDSSFAADLENFDSMPTRNHNTVFVFYLKAGQSTKEEVCAARDFISTSLILLFLFPLSFFFFKKKVEKSKKYDKNWIYKRICVIFNLNSNI